MVKKQRNTVQNILEDILKRKNKSYHELAFLANQTRQYIVEMVYTAASGHMGGPLGLADIFTLLYFKHLNISPRDPFWPERDRLILSNGHVCAVRYASMSLRGFFPKADLKTFRKLGSKFQGHPSTKFLPEIENSSGSLGQGLSVASGLALGLRLQNMKGDVFVCLSDGECQEGMTWEAAMAAAHYRNEKLIAFVDMNNIQIDGYVKNILDVGNLKKKFESFGWAVLKTDGHNLEAIDRAFCWARESKILKKPRIILFKTILGQGVDFMSNNPYWHGKPPGKEEYIDAMEQLKKTQEQIIQELESY